ncbi:MAG TPA: efflux RND transporter periplasmic adaptor subunit [Thermoanaerobaculia bacterium]|nr:efflux RND transporter periplasmic adaptor subunit [Thermoanaerobaculia bacterium]
MPRSISRLQPRPLHLSRLATLVVAALLLACGYESPDRERDDGGPTPIVEAVEARSGTLPLEERLTGVVKAENQVAIRPQVSAPIVEVMVRNGEAVRRGQPLVRLDDSTIQEQLRQAEADRRLTRAAWAEERARVAELVAQVTRTRALHAQELVSELELETQEAQLAARRAAAEQAEARVEQTEAVIAERQAALARTIVRAPVDGRVGDRDAEVGMLAGTDTMLFLIGDLDSLRIEVPLTERMLAYVEVGQRVRIEAPSIGPTPIEAALSRISPFLTENSFSTIGEIDVANRGDRLRPGMFVTVDILYGESEQATLLPTSTLWEDLTTGEFGIYIAPEMGTITMQTETTGSEALQPVAFRQIELVAEGRSTIGVRGVEPGDWVVTVGQHMIASREDPAVLVRPTTWTRVLELQELQREDVLRGFLEKQQRLMRGARDADNRPMSGPSGRTAGSSSTF